MSLFLWIREGGSALAALSVTCFSRTPRWRERYKWA